jgi:cell division protein FtsW
MSVAQPVPASTRVIDRSAAKPTAKPKTTLKREQHQADYSILVSVIALSAIGILMVYSSSAMKAYLQNDDTLAIVGPQIQWAGLGIVAMLLAMRVDYRYLRLVSIPMFGLALCVLALVLVLPASGLVHSVVVGGSARWLQIGPLPAIHPAEFAKLAMIVYLAHWMAKRGTRISSFLGGTIPFLIIVAPVVALVFKEPDLGTTMVLGLTAFVMFFVAGANLAHLAVMGSIAFFGIVLVGLRGYQIERIQAWINPWSDPLGKGFHSIQGLLALALGGVFGAGLGESRQAGSSCWRCSSCSDTRGSGRLCERRIPSAPSSPPGSPRGCACRHS